MSTHEPTMTGTKVCTKCERDLPVIQFAVNKKSKDGLHNECRECSTERMHKLRPRKGISERKFRSMKHHRAFLQDD